MAESSPCPDVPALQALMVGLASDQEAETLEEHVADCPHCLATLSRLETPDVMVDRLRRCQDVAAALSPSPAVLDLMRRLQKLRPPSASPAGSGSRTIESAAGDTPAPDAGPERFDFLAPAQQPDEIGRLGPYRILKVLGAGGMGIVFQAEDPQLQRLVALKVMKTTLGAGAAVRERFRREARAVAVLHHSNIVPIFGVGEDRGIPYYAMQFIQGQGLDAVVREGPARNGENRREVARIGLQVADALAYAHRQGILHRDIKPSNLLRDGQGTIWVMDFGLVKAEGEGELTGPSDVVGTLRYLAPERFSGRSSPESDIYSLGATLHELLTGRPPFDETDRIRLIERITHGAAPAPSGLQDGIPADLETIVQKAMAKDPADRYRSAESLGEDLRRFLIDRPILARRARLPERTWRWCRRNPVVAGLLAAAMMLATGLGVLALLLWDKQQQTETALKQADLQRHTAEERRRIAERNFQRSSALLHNATFKRQLDWLQPHGLWPLEGDNHERLHALLRRFPAQPGPDLGDRLLTAQIRMELADILVTWKRRAEAVQGYRKAIALLTPLVQEFPQEVIFRDFLAHCLSYMAYQQGWMKVELAGSDDGEKAFRQAIALYEGLRKQLQSFPWYRLQLSHCWSDLGETRRRLGRYQPAEEAYRKGLALRQQLCDEFPRSTRLKNLVTHSHNLLAWVLVTRPDWQPHQAAEALEHAKKAVADEPGWHDWWHTLGVAHCRVGQAKEALAAIEKSRQLNPTKGPPDSFDRFFEAIAYSQLGDLQKARRSYDEGVQWMEKHLPDHADLGRFRDEAAAVLKIQEQKTRPRAKAKGRQGAG